MGRPTGVILNTDLEIFSWNCRSIKNKETEFKKHTENYDIIAIQETWLKYKHNFNFESFETIRKDRTGRRAGGLMFLIKDSIQFVEKTLQTYQNGQIEIQAIKLKTNEGPIDIVNLYNPVTILSKREFCHYLN